MCRRPGGNLLPVSSPARPCQNMFRAPYLRSVEGAKGVRWSSHVNSTEFANRRRGTTAASSVDAPGIPNRLFGVNGMAFDPYGSEQPAQQSTVGGNVGRLLRRIRLWPIWLLQNATGARGFGASFLGRLRLKRTEHIVATTGRRKEGDNFGASCNLGPLSGTGGS
jgi:hypothetical protein